GSAEDSPRRGLCRVPGGARPPGGRRGAGEFGGPGGAGCPGPPPPNPPPPAARAEPARRYGECRKQIPEDITARLRRLARQHQLTLGTFVQAAWAVLLSRYSNSAGVVFGVVRAGRPPVDGRIVGTFINTLPVRVRISSDSSVGALLNDVRAYNVSLRAHEHTPLA